MGVLDPLSGPNGPYNLTKDTSHLLLLEFQRRGHRIFLSDPSGIGQRGKNILIRARPARVLSKKPYFRLEREHVFPAEFFRLILMRKDPPVDRSYVKAARLLHKVKPPAWVSNRPESLLRWNEKRVILQFPQWIPPSLVSHSVSKIRQFAKRQGGRIVLKSLSSFGGKEVALADLEDPRFGRIVQRATRGRTDVMVQTFLDKVREGEKRIFLIDGKPLGALKRIPPRGGFLANPDLGARLERAKLTSREKKLCAALGPFLRRHGIFFAGADVIDGYLTEMNMTSPGLLWEWNGVAKARYERKIVDLYEKKLRGL